MGRVLNKMESSCKPVSCTVKPPVHLQFGDTKTDTSRSGVSVIDVTFPTGQTVNVKELCFKNCYTAFLTLRLLRRDPSEPEAPARWITCLRDYSLMPDPHTEEGSQDYFTIHRQQMLVEPDRVRSLRLILRQPSSSWLHFGLEALQIYPHLEQDVEREVPDWLSDLNKTEQHTLVEGLPDPQTVSSSLQQMWALTEVMQTNQTSASIGRFDVDGCYDINLLSFS
ncbi:nicolin-1 [Aplochiton taeniatus]